MEPEFDYSALIELYNQAFNRDAYQRIAGRCSIVETEEYKVFMATFSLLSDEHKNGFAKVLQDACKQHT